MKSQPPSRTYHSRDREKRVGGSTKWLLEFLLGAGMCQLPSILLAKRDDKAKLDSGLWGRMKTLTLYFLRCITFQADKHFAFRQ